MEDRRVTSEQQFPDDVRYSEEHDWARLTGEDSATFGITWYAQESLGEIVFFDPPAVGAEVTRGEAYAELESVKAVSDVVAPLSGKIIDVNAVLAADPSTVNRDPYVDGWLVRVTLTQPSETGSLIDAAAYRIQVGQ
jgi:glycine cleavage system H protein